MKQRPGKRDPVPQGGPSGQPPCSGRRDTALILVGNPFFRDNGWHDIRVYRFVKSFQEYGYDPIVYCNTYAGATRQSGVYDGIRYRRLLFDRGIKTKPPHAEAQAPPAADGEPGVISEPLSEPAPPPPSPDRQPPGDHRKAASMDSAPPDLPHRAVRFCRRNVRSLVRKGSRLPRVLPRRTRNAASRLSRILLRKGRTAVKRLLRIPLRMESWGMRLLRKIAQPVYRYLNLKFMRAAMEATLDEKPAFVYGVDLSLLRTASRIARRAGAPLLYDSHEYFYSCAEHSWMSWWRRTWDRAVCSLLERRYFGQAHTVISVSQGIVDAFKERMPWGNYMCIRNLPVPRHDVGRQDIIVKKLGLPAGTKVALYIGYITGGRGTAQTIMAARHLPDDIVVAFLGGGRLLEEKRALARSLNLTHKVFFLGHVPQTRIPDFAESATCGLCLIQNTCLSYYYSLPNKLFQYMSAGLPIVCSDFPDMRRVVEGWGLGVAVDPSDPQAIAEGIQRICHDQRTYERMRANCIRAMTEELNWEVEKEKLLLMDFIGDNQ